jgi:putative phosphoserine phosphatase/1-acylglycerol-3-phosphate O-acyltransferase
MGTAAAFFDLDRTLLLGASGPVISKALRRHGVLPDRSIPGEGLLFGLFNALGENLPAILLTRQGARAAKGWSVEAVRAAAHDAADEMIDLIEPFATETIEEHRAAGRKLVLATTTPYDIVTPLADRLGFDDVLATRYRTTTGPDGDVYDGTIDGEFVWSTGKSRMVSAWAMANLVELADSYAYSDSIFDVPMLSSVGNPVAVNPDPRLLAYATLRGWPKVWFNAPAGVPKPMGVELQQIIAAAARPELLPWINFDVEGLENVPADGGVILAPNHRSYIDPIVVAHVADRLGRPARFLAKKEVTDTPVFGHLIKSLGTIRVDRGSGSDTPLMEAARVLRAGELVALFPQGTIPRGDAFFQPELKGRYGAVRLAVESGAPIVPVGLWGSERVWPRHTKLPYLMNVADPPTVQVRIGTPFEPRSDDPAAATEDLMARIVDLLPPQARHYQAPTPEELARTYPDGVIPDA